MPLDDRMRLKQAYGRVDRVKLKETLRAVCKDNGVEVLASSLKAEATAVNNIYGGASLAHDAEGSTLALEDGTSIRCKAVVDCTGAESRLIRREAVGDFPPLGFQIAYGMEVEVECDDDLCSYVGPYDANAMLLFDYRTDGFKAPAAQDVERVPTFMYAMPLERTGPKRRRIFFEETSLVARPAVSFAECKRRAYERLGHHGIKVREVFEEEYCYIPMGGPLPARGQRTIAFGAAGGQVHAATGYQLCRAFAAATPVADAIAAGIAAGDAPAKVSADAYSALWTPENQRQRDFAVFGGDFLMQQDATVLLGFFQAFFQLPTAFWSGFLAGWPGLPNNEKHETWNSRLEFGMRMFLLAPNAVRLALVKCAVDSAFRYGVKDFLRSVTPLFGAPDDYAKAFEAAPEELGDAAAKAEAIRMMAEAAKAEAAKAEAAKAEAAKAEAAKAEAAKAEAAKAEAAKAEAAKAEAAKAEAAKAEAAKVEAAKVEAAKIEAAKAEAAKIEAAKAEATKVEVPAAEAVAAKDEAPAVEAVAAKDEPGAGKDEPEAPKEEPGTLQEA